MAPVITKAPSLSPSRGPSLSPSASPTAEPSSSPTQPPSVSPSASPSRLPTVSPSKQPTRDPSQSPSNSPFVETAAIAQYYTACGSSANLGAAYCDGETKIANIEDLHEVRCCSDTNLGSGWNKRTGCNVWGESDINGVCNRDKSFDQAAGARLCTQDELLDDCTRGTGCSFDREQIWSSSYPGPVEQITKEYQVEDYGGSGVTVKTTHAGYTGGGFLDYGSAGTYVEINNVDGGVGGVCSITTRYANGGTWTRRCKINVNGVDQPGEMLFQPISPAGEWNNWANSNTLQIDCEPGTSNTIRIIGLTSGPNLDKAMIESSAYTVMNP